VIYTVEELSGSWKVTRKDVDARTGLDAVRRACERPGMYRTAASTEPERHYFWLSSRGTLEDVDQAGR